MGNRSGMAALRIEQRFQKLERYARHWVQAKVDDPVFPDLERMTVSRAEEVGGDILALLEIAKHGERRARVRGGVR